MGENILGIYGAGGLGREVLELAKIINDRKKRWDSFVFIVDGVSDREISNVKVLEYSEAKNRYGESLEVSIGIGEPAIREKKFRQLREDGIRIPTLIHPDVHIPETTTVGQGVVIQYGCFISCNVSIGDNVFIQPQCNIGHDDILSEGCMISGFGNIAGAVRIGKYTYIGLSASLKECVIIGDYSIVGMGAVVPKDVADEMVVLGNPARPIARNSERKVFKH